MEVKSFKQLIFSLNKGYYGFSILKVKEVIGMVKTIPIPHAPSFIKGVINLRGRIMPVMDLRIKFGMAQEDYTERTCIVIVEVLVNDKARQMGVIVDGISEVIEINKEDIEPPPQYAENDDCDFIDGIAKIKGKVVMLLNIESIINCDAVTILFPEKEEKKKETKEKVSAKK